jgi:serine protease Do
MKKFVSIIGIIISLLAILPTNAQSFFGETTEKVVPSSHEDVIFSYAPLVKKASPAVVNIYTSKKVKVQRHLSPFFNDPIFQHFFGGDLSGNFPTERIESSLGSGVIVKSDGLIVTNYHVIADSTDIKIVLSDRREFEAKIVLQDQRTDLALLKIEANEELPFLELMDSDELEVGDIVIAIGNPFGVGQTVTSGIVSALARTTIGISDYQFFIQTDASINPGNSGGALINMQGKLAGLNSAIFSKTGESNGVGFAIPSNMVATVIKSDGTKVVRPWLGVEVQAVTQEIAKSLGLDRPIGAILSAIHPDSPVTKAGLKVGDVITGIENHEVLDEQALNFRVATYPIGSYVNIAFIRDGKLQNAQVQMIAPPETPKRDLRVISGDNPLSGATVANLSPAVADELGIRIYGSGVIITNIDIGTASRTGIKKNDIVKNVNSVEITSSEQLEDILKKKTQSWQITLQRGNRLLNVLWNVR